MRQHSLHPQLVSVFNSMKEPVHIIDRNFRIVLFNDSFKKWSETFGYSTDVIGKKLTAVFPFLSERPLAEYNRIFETGERMNIEDRTDNRKEDYYDIQRIPIFDIKTGKVTHIVTILRDVTQNVLNVEALKESELKYKSLVQTMGEGVWVTDKADKTIHVNPTLVKMLGYSEEEILGREVRDFLSPKSVEIFQEISKQRLTGAVPASKYELKFLTKNGLILHTRIAGTSLFNENNEFVGSFGVISDISEEKRFQQLQERFIGVTTHELKSPLTILTGYMELLQNKNSISEELLSEIYRSMENTIQRLVQLVQSVHDLNAIQVNAFTVNPRSTNLNAFISEFKEQIQILYPNRLVLIDELSIDDSTYVRMDSNRINQVLENLVDNAIKNSADDQYVSVIFRNLNENLVISVLDFGTGIPNEQIFHLFQPFSHRPTEFSQRGTGLGLYIVKSIVSSHNGIIEVLSQENSGTCFTIILPKN